MEKILTVKPIKVKKSSKVRTVNFVETDKGNRYVIFGFTLRKTKYRKTRITRMEKIKNEREIHLKQIRDKIFSNPFKQQKRDD